MRNAATKAVTETSNTQASLKRGRPRTPERDIPPLSAHTVEQMAALNPGIGQERLRTWIHRADSGDPDFHWLRLCTIRVGRSVFIDEFRFRAALHLRTAFPASPSRNKPKESSGKTGSAK